MPKIDTSAIEGYESMSAEEKLAALESYEYSDNSDELSKYKNAVSKANSEAAEYKRQLKDANSKIQQAEEKGKEGQTEAEKQIAEMKKQLDAMKRDKSVSDYTSRLVSNGFESDMASKAATALVDHDADSFFDSLSKFVEEHDKKVRAEIAQHSIAPKAGPKDSSGETGMTKKKLLSMSLLEQNKFSIEHPDEYKKLMS